MSVEHNGLLCPSSGQEVCLAAIIPNAFAEMLVVVATAGKS